METLIFKQYPIWFGSGASFVLGYFSTLMHRHTYKEKNNIIVDYIMFKSIL